MPAPQPMLATLEDAPLDDPAFAYEPKYDGIRGIAEIGPGKIPVVRIWSRAGNEKTHQFPEIAAALVAFRAGRSKRLILDGEIVALDQRGRPTGFERLQGRMHLGRAHDVARRSGTEPVAYIVFDILADGDENLEPRPLHERRKRLETLFARRPPGVVRLGEHIPRDGRSLWDRARTEGWEGLVAKRLDSPYRRGQRSPAWRKMKLVHAEEFVVCGWTEPRGSRTGIGALVLGVREDRAWRHVGSVGSGLGEREIARLRLRLGKEVETCPFAMVPETNERPHWVKPGVVVQVRFAERTQAGLLRQPIYLGVRDDKRATEVTAPVVSTAPAPPPAPATGGLADVMHQLEEMERGRNQGILSLPGHARLKITNLRKPFWPALGFTKGDLFRYYTAVAPYILPVVADRPLIMRRHPDGIDGPAFYQQQAPQPAPTGVRTAVLPDDGDVPRRLIGGSLLTLLYMTQLATISQDPWFSRVDSSECPDFVALDLDPMEGATFDRVLDVARFIRDEMARVGLEGWPKTSGASGLHIYVPMPPGTPYKAALLFCQVIAAIVARKHPKVATVERSVSKRDTTSVYIDALQNIRGKSLACAYSARASDFAGASTPVRWSEVDAGFDRRDFTIRTLPARLESVGDLWAGLGASKGADLEAVLRLTTSTRAR